MLSHINQTRIETLVNDGILKELKVNSLPTCESYLEAKMTKKSFPLKGHWANNLLELVHLDVCGPFNINARGDYEHFFIDDYSRYGYAY